MNVRNMNAMLLTAALSGLMYGTSAAQTPNHSNSNSPTVNAANASLLYVAAKGDKHSCKGKNSCKGKGGCSSSDNGCKGKNSCKGKGGCNTKGSCAPKSPSLV